MEFDYTTPVLPDYLHLSKPADLPYRADRLRYRLYEIIPGALAWITLFLIVFFSFTRPVAATIFIIIFDSYWLIKTIYLTVHLRVAFRQMRRNIKVHWLGELNTMPVGDLDWNDIRHLILLPAY